MSGGRRSSRLLVLLSALVVLGAIVGPAAALDRPPWVDSRWRFRKLLKLPDDYTGAACVWVHLRPEADNGGRDLRVIRPDGRPAPFGVIHATPEGRYLVAFQARQKGGLYAVYYGNPAASPAAQEPPQQGLIYETRPLPQDARSGTWRAAAATLQRAVPAFGADYWGRVFDAFNPFGPQQGYIGIHHGYILCPKAGVYRFATLSDNSSFLLIDDQLVAQWPGRHNAARGRRGEHSGSISLTKGMHRFRYVHFAARWQTRAAAAWIPPDRKWWSIIPEWAFKRPARAEVYECEEYGKPLCADFTAAPLSYCEAGDARMVRLRFGSTSVASDGLIEGYHWEFGDGQDSAEPLPEHVFLEPGVYAVKLTVLSDSGVQAVCAKNVKVAPIWNDLDFSAEKLARFLDGVRGYRLEKLPTPCLLGAWDLFKNRDAQDLAVSAARALDGRAEELEPPRQWEVAMSLGRHGEKHGDEDSAEQFYEKALKAVPENDTRRRVEARFALADLYLYGRRDPEEARRRYVELRADFPGASHDTLRRALIRIGDTYRDQRKPQEALEKYRQAEADEPGEAGAPKAVLKESGLQGAEAYLQVGESEQAIERLDELLWRFPTLRLEGRPSLLRARAEMQRGDFRAARRCAEGYLAFGKDPNWAPALHIQAAEACRELGLTEEAQAHYRAILKNYPESPEAQEARAHM